jgi:hypothetical protein
MLCPESRAQTPADIARDRKKKTREQWKSYNVSEKSQRERVEEEPDSIGRIQSVRMKTQTVG